MRRWLWVAVVLLVAVFAAQLLGVARGTSANWDEPHHLYDGYNIWTRGDFRLNAEVPPLVKMAAALPLLGQPLHRPAAMGEPGWENPFRAGRAFLVANGVDRVLEPARLVCMVWALALVVVVFFAARKWWGLSAGVAALALLVWDPLLLAHGSLVNTDVASALFLFGGVWAFWRWTEQPTTVRLAAAGVVAGLAMAAKFTGLLILPMLGAVCVVEAVRSRRWRECARSLAGVAVVALVAWGVVWSFYGFRWAAAPGGLEFSGGWESYVLSVPDPRQGRELASVGRHGLLPEAYVWGLANTKKTEAEYTAYFLGRVVRHGGPGYFPVAFAVKSTLPLLVLLSLAPWVLWRAPGVGRKAVFLLVPVGVYGAVIMRSHFDIGARHLLPVYPFLYVLAGAALAAMWARGRGWAAVAGLLLVWQVGTSLRVAPRSYMAYGNELAGGPLGVRRYLSDANVDWGQQLKDVRGWLAANRVAEGDCWFGYFPDGAVEPADYGVHCRRLPTPSGTWWLKLPMDVPEWIDGTVLLSESVMDGVESGDGALNPYRDFQSLAGPMRPVAVIDDGVYVFRGRFRVALASAWVEVRRSEQLQGAGEMAGALAAAERAVQLAPDQARTELRLGQVLLARGQKQEARERFAEAQHWLEANRPELEEEELGPAIEAGLRGAAGR